jgi:hypothetical protein
MVEIGRLDVDIKINYQIALVDAITVAQNILTNKQVTDSEAGNIASDLFNTDLSASEEVLDQDGDNIDDITTTGNSNGWNTTSTNDYNAANQYYQNDTTVCQTGQNVANTAVQTLQTQVGTDGTNLSNILSISSTFVDIGQFMTGIMGQAYT